jgi:amidase
VRRGGFVRDSGARSSSPLGPEKAQASQAPAVVPVAISMGPGGSRARAARPIEVFKAGESAARNKPKTATSARTPEVDVVRWRQAAIEIGAAKEPYLDRTVRGNTLSHRDWLKLNNERHGLRRAFAAFFADWDVLLCPAAASAAWPHDQKGERWTRKIMVNGTQVPSTDQLFWAGYSSLVYLPSTVGPAGLTKSGLPVGYQAIAASGRDKTATAFSRLVEKEIAGFVPPPGFD